MAHGPSGSRQWPRRRRFGVFLTGLGLWPLGLLGAAGSGSIALAQPPVPAPPTPTASLGLLDALELALARDPNIALVETNLRSARANLEISRAEFDPQLGSDLVAGRDQGADPHVASLDADVSADLRLRSGLAIGADAGLSRVAKAGGDTSNTGNLSVALRQPLARGRGREVTTTGERVAEQELLATRDDVEQQVAARLRTVANLYWNFLSAAENLEILRDTEARSRRFLDNTRRLVESDLAPAADLVQLEANLLSRSLSRRAGERSLIEARQELGREIGLDAAAILALPLPGDAYPPLDPDAAPGIEDAAAFIELARAHRADLRADFLRVEEQRLRVRFFENALKPQLDLVLTPSYVNTVDGGSAGDFFAPFSRDIPGLAATLGLSWRFSPPNRAARGDLENQRAALERSELQVRLTELQIGADLPAALDDVSFRAEQLAKSREALALFERALDNEEKKLRAGSSTLIDVLNQQDQLIFARQQVNESRLGLALAILRLRFETGTLIDVPEAAGELSRVSLTSFLTLPQLPR